MNRIFEKDGKKYLRIGNIAIPFSRVDKDGVPIIDKPIVQDFIDANGKPSKRVIVNCLKIQSANLNP